MGTMVRPSDGKSCASLAGINEIKLFQIAVKTQRFELDVPTTSAWDLFINMAEYL